MKAIASEIFNFSLLKSIFNDARNFQIIYLSIFLLYGIEALGWVDEIPSYGIIIGSCLATQALCVLLTTKNFSSLRSGMISALGLCLLLNVDNPWFLVLASVIAIGGKFLIRFRGKHIYNPANLGIVAILALGEGTVNPGQWGSEILFVYFVGFLALVILLKVGRLFTSLTFLAAYFAMAYYYNIVYKGWPLDFLELEFSSGALLLFTFFMITDPMTTPNSQLGRLIFALAVAGLTFYLKEFVISKELFGQVIYFNASAPIWALFLVAPLTLILDAWLKGKKYNWESVGPEVLK